MPKKEEEEIKVSGCCQKKTSDKKWSSLFKCGRRALERPKRKSQSSTKWNQALGGYNLSPLSVPSRVSRYRWAISVIKHPFLSLFPSFMCREYKSCRPELRGQYISKVVIAKRKKGFIAVDRYFTRAIRPGIREPWCERLSFFSLLLIKRLSKNETE